MVTNSRTRSEYRLTIDASTLGETVAAVSRPSVDDNEAVAELLLDAYRGTIDDEGETMVEAREAATAMLGWAHPAHSVVLRRNSRLIALCFVQEVADNFYIDPIVVAAAHKQQGLGRRMVATCLASLAATGVTSAGATITDGNEASERLFASLGATRIGAWPPTVRARRPS